MVRGEHRLRDQGDNALGQHAAKRLGGGGQTDIVAEVCKFHAVTVQQLRRLFGLCAADADRHTAPVHRNGGHDRALHEVALAVRKHRSDLPLRLGRGGVHVQIELTRTQQRRGLTGDRQRHVRTGEAEEHVAPGDQLRHVGHQRHLVHGRVLAHFLRAGRVILCRDVEGADLHITVHKVTRDVVRRFAEPDKS